MKEQHLFHRPSFLLLISSTESPGKPCNLSRCETLGSRDGLTGELWGNTKRHNHVDRLESWSRILPLGRLR